jgi:hypothetical protein
VLNVNPTLDPIFATNVTPQGFTTLDLTFADPGADSFEVLVDWGDKLDMPPQDRYVVERAYAGATPKSYTITHRYLRPPDPLHPSADIIISVKVQDDDFGTTALDIGESNVESFTIRNPGIGPAPFRIDTTPQVPQLSFPSRVDAPPLANNFGNNIVFQQNIELRAASGEAQAATERFIELRVIDAEGNEGPTYRLSPDVLQDLPRLFRSLPDNHYAVYIVNMETNTRRLVIEVYVRNGKLIDPSDDSEGTRDRPPTDEQQSPDEVESPVEQTPTATNQGAAVVPASFDPLALDYAGAISSVTVQRSSSRWTALAVGLAASASSQSWAHRVDQALAQATAQQWRKLQGHNPHRPKNQ